MKLKNGYVQVYTGDGKGKTTAAIGQAIRAIGAHLQVYFVQFMKDYGYSEVALLESYSPRLVLKRYGNDRFVFKKQPPDAAMIDEVHAGLLEAQRQMAGGQYDMIIMDELLVSIYFKLFNTEEVMQFIKRKPPNVEMILTGRYCPEAIIETADLVTEMREVKHYYQKNVKARRGIES